MTSEHVWTAAELGALPASERDIVVRQGFVTDPTRVPAHLLERARLKTDARIATAEGNEAAH